MRLLNPALITALALVGLSNSVTAQAISSGSNFTLSICNNGSVSAWGENYNGQLGNGTYTASHMPLQVSSLTGVTAVSAGGDDHALALKSDGSVWAWGNNIDGQLGNGTTNGANIPVQVNALTGVIAIAGGVEHSLALKSDGTVWSWGGNNRGQLGNGTNAASSVPVQVNGLSGVVAIAAGTFQSYAVMTDGTVRAWGDNQEGDLGNGSTSDSNVPVQVSSLTGVSAIAAGRDHALALKSDGTIWSWGSNLDGQLGNGVFANSSVPVSISSLSGITAIAAGGGSSDYSHSLALKNDGTMWAWGSNVYGQLGNGMVYESNIPMQVSSLSGITAIGKGTFNSFAIKNDGTIWAWGYNANGQLGNGTTTSTAITTQVVNLCVPNAINDQDSYQGISVYPNPSDDFITIKSPASETGAPYMILNGIGKLVSEGSLSHLSTTINISTLPAGMYILRTGESDTQNFKLIKN